MQLPHDHVLKRDLGLGLSTFHCPIYSATPDIVATNYVTCRPSSMFVVSSVQCYSAWQINCIMVGIV